MYEGDPTIDLDANKKCAFLESEIDRFKKAIDVLDSHMLKALEGMRAANKDIVRTVEDLEREIKLINIARAVRADEDRAQAKPEQNQQKLFDEVPNFDHWKPDPEEETPEEDSLTVKIYETFGKIARLCHPDKTKDKVKHKLFIRAVKLKKKRDLHGLLEILEAAKTSKSPMSSLLNKLMSRLRSLETQLQKVKDQFAETLNSEEYDTTKRYNSSNRQLVCHMFGVNMMAQAACLASQLKTMREEEERILKERADASNQRVAS